jgi:hypothetical protein
MELASMLAGESFSDRPASTSRVIAAFLRTYNDGVDGERRQDLYQLAAVIVGTAAGRAVERERVSRCLEFARSLGTGTPTGRAAIGIASGGSQRFVGRHGCAPQPRGRDSCGSARLRPRAGRNRA